mgnify:CR=1 FL=1
MILQGIAASDGIGIGPAVCIRAREPDCSAVPYSGREKERDRLQAAADLCAKQTAVLAERVRTQAGSKATDPHRPDHNAGRPCPAAPDGGDH